MPTYTEREKLQILQLYVRGGLGAVNRLYPRVAKTTVQKYCRQYEQYFNRLLDHWRIKEHRLLAQGHIKKFLSQFRPLHFSLSYDRLQTTCVEWQGGKEVEGYGRFRVGQRRYYTHYLAYTLFTKSRHTSNHNNVLLHSCDNPSCGNPFHLTLGTHTENMQDAKSKGRNRIFGDTSLLHKAEEFSKLFDDD